METADKNETESTWPSNRRTVEEWAVQIGTIWQNNVKGIFDVARTLETARAELGPRSKEWTQLYRDELKLSQPTVSMLIAIAEDKHGNLSDHYHDNGRLPPSYNTLYALTKLDPEQFKAGVASGVIHAGMERKDVAEVVHGQHLRGSPW